MTFDRPLRSLLFAPGNDERKLAKALREDATLVVADWEDAVPAAEKAAARELTAKLIAEAAGGRPQRLASVDERGTESAARAGERGAGRARRLRPPRAAPTGEAVDPPWADTPMRPLRAVRINALDEPEAAADLEAVATLPLDAIVIPKVEVGQLETLAGAGLPPLLAIVETPRGLQHSDRIATAPGVAALVLGSVDLSHSLRLPGRADGLDLLYARSKLVIDSAAAGIEPPIDGIYTTIDDLDGLRAEADMVRSLGLGGKACIHPSHIEPIEQAFRPSPEELAWAARVVAAYTEAQARGSGAIRVDGAMIDVPVVARARALLAGSDQR